MGVCREIMQAVKLSSKIRLKTFETAHQNNFIALNLGCFGLRGHQVIRVLGFMVQVLELTASSS